MSEEKEDKPVMWAHIGDPKDWWCIGDFVFHPRNLVYATVRNVFVRDPVSGEEDPNPTLVLKFLGDTCELQMACKHEKVAHEILLRIRSGLGIPLHLPAFWKEKDGLKPWADSNAPERTFR